MLSRRTFIKSALATNVALLARPSQALQQVLTGSEEIPLLVFADEHSAHSKHFISNVAERKSNIDLDIGQHFDLLREFCKESPMGQISGLTRDSDFFALEQIAKDFGFYTQYSATHHYSGNMLTHEVSSSKDSAELITSSLKNAKEQWPQWLANHMRVLPRGNAQLVTQKTQISLANTDQHDFLVSWSLSPNKNK
ncbi:hypothetical protein [Cycloclasticus zancles]|uniref:Uncharacterized protein n=1 Tax=Cycloclasticus zancles 78-ME TaxID=1198232 RepID=S5TA33_9GAMM|nr:hypothetical protein [Cycloclasticus zancles]AGS40444.1 hypothetical protein CYCME_2130 [Cycloclasticus zancles 78-ME]